MLEHLLTRIAYVDPDLRSFVELDTAAARTAAADSDRRIVDLRELEGVPIAIKSNIAVAGLRWTAGMQGRKAVVATHDAEAVSILRAAGAIILGTLNMDEAALGATGDNRFFGRVSNPHAPKRSPGGSSGGSAAAVAAGLCFAALGTDTLGSVRIPAAYTGIYGLKPGAGAVTTQGVFPLAGRLDTIGILARSLDDICLVSTILVPHLEHSQPVTIATLKDLGHVICEPAVLAAYSSALEVLGGAQYEVALPCLASTLRTGAFVEVACELAENIDALSRDALSPDLHRLLRYAARTNPQTDLLAQAHDMLRDALIGRVLVLPSVPQAAFLHGDRAPTNQADFTVLANIAGLPALAIPAGRDSFGLPVSVQLIGGPNSESRLLALGRLLDSRLRGYAPPPLFP